MWPSPIRLEEQWRSEADVGDSPDPTYSIAADLLFLFGSECWSGPLRRRRCVWCGARAWCPWCSCGPSPGRAPRPRLPPLAMQFLRRLPLRCVLPRAARAFPRFAFSSNASSCTSPTPRRVLRVRRRSGGA
jgi:hypothetical protein